MDGLRWLLLAFGLLIVAGVYLYTRYQRDRADESNEEIYSGDRVEPLLGESDTLDGESMRNSTGEPAADAALADSGDQTPTAAQKIVTLRIVARDNGAFAGDELVLSLRGIGMRHGKFGIFHRFEGSDEGKIIFSAASLVEPGSFDLTNIKDQKIPGISLFMVLPGPVEGAAGFDLMMTASRTLSRSLDAELLDETGSTLSVQRERYLREEIIQHQHNLVVA